MLCTCTSNRVAELIPFYAVPLFGPEAGRTIITIFFSLWVRDVMVADILPRSVHVVLNGQELAITVM